MEFKKDYPESTPILLYGGQEKIMKKNILCLPISDFLLSLYPDKSIHE